MPSLRERTILQPEKSFLAFPDHYVNLPAYFLYTDIKNVVADFVVLDDTGKKVIKAGTVVYMDGDGKCTKPTYVTGNPGTGNKGNAIVFDTINVDFFDTNDTKINVAALVHGFVRKDRLTNAAQLLDCPMINIVNK